MIKTYLPLLIILFFSACGGGSTKQTTDHNKSNFVSEKLLIDLNYKPYSDSIVIDIMNEVGLCEKELTSISKDSIARLPCDFSLLRTFMNHADNDWKSGFLVELRGGVVTETFRVLNIAFIEDQYQVTNEFFGELLEMRTTEFGNYELFIRYTDAEIGTVGILHQWKVNHYEPVRVEEINDHFVKKEKQDSLNKLYIDNFKWGF